jgi:hypothetical protein
MTDIRQEIALSRTDLVQLETEPRVLDVRIGAALGMAQPLNIRRVIERNRGELEMHGPIHAAREMVRIGSGAKRETTVFYLNEPQALLLCMFSRTERAAAVRAELIRVFMEWRRGALRPVDDRFEASRRRVQTVEATVEALGRMAPLATRITHLPLWRNGRRPAFWSDFEVRSFLTEAHRQMTLKEARGVSLDRFGPARSPSLSAIHRYWALLDTARSASAEEGRSQ